MKDLREFIDLLESRGELIRIEHPVSAHLEITEITDRISKAPPEENKALLFENVDKTNIPVLINTFGSQRQRTAIARFLVLNPDLLLMDEPFSSVDAPTREELQLLTLELVNEQNLTLILVTHSIEEAAFMGKKILLLSKPPNNSAVIINNPSSGTGEYRESEEYNKMCKDLRKGMDQG